MHGTPVFSMCSTRVSGHPSTPPGLWNISILSNDFTVFSSVFWGGSILSMPRWFLGPKHTLEQLFFVLSAFVRRPDARDSGKCYNLRCFYVFGVAGDVRAHSRKHVVFCMFLLVSCKGARNDHQPWEIRNFLADFVVFSAGFCKGLFR